MKFKVFSGLLLSLSFVLFTGCGGGATSVYNVKQAPVTTLSENHTLLDVKKAILQAGLTSGWQMKKVSRGVILARLNVREHMAQIKITYNKQTYNIDYKDSSNLNYDGTNIHKNYNKWIQKLEKRIRVYLGRVSH